MPTSSCSPRPALVILAVLASCTLTSTAAAQDDGDALATQTRYNREAVEAMHAGDHAQAVLLLESALTVGELNMTWLNLGRARHHLGRCEAARDAFARVDDAPPVEMPSAAEVASVRDAWRAELDAECTGAIVLSCTDTPDGVWIAGARRDAGCAGTIPVRPGTVRVIVAFDGERIELPVDVPADAPEPVSVAVERPAADPDPEPDPPAAASGPPPIDAPLFTPLGIAGWTVVGFGAATLAGGLVMDAVYVGPALDDYRAAAEADAAMAAELKPGLLDRQAATLGVTFAGAGLLAIGATLVVIDVATGSSTSAPELALSPSGASATWRF